MSVLAAPPEAEPRHDDARPSRLWGAVVVAVVALALAGAVYWVAVWTSWGQIVDQYVLDAVRRLSAVAHVPYPVTVAVVTDVRVWFAAAVLVIVGSSLPTLTGRVRWGRSIATTATLLLFPLLIAVIARVLRDVVLIRPQLHDWILETSNSAPSGHAAAVTSCVVVLIAASPKWLRPFVIALGGTWASVITFGLIADGWHRPSDIVISVLIVIGLGALLPDPYAATPAPRGAIALRALAWVFTVISSAILVGTSYPEPRQIMTAVGIAAVIGLALGTYRPLTVGRR
ncbi:phosphatase PAP2 family protein [Gordonia sp. NPDC003504]